MKTVKQKTHSFKLLAGYWQVFLQTAEGKKKPLFKQFQEFIRLERNARYKIVLQRMR